MNQFLTPGVKFEKLKNFEISHQCWLHPMQKERSSGWIGSKILIHSNLILCVPKQVANRGSWKHFAFTQWPEMPHCTHLSHFVWIWVLYEVKIVSRSGHNVHSSPLDKFVTFRRKNSIEWIWMNVYPPWPRPLSNFGPPPPCRSLFKSPGKVLILSI